MGRGYWFLVCTQFFSAFADNAIFFSLVGLATEKGIDAPDQYMSNLQTAFLAAYIVLAPFVGTLADRHAKANILRLGNVFKASGVILMLFGLPPVICYTVFGVGAVIYSPAKYGILTDLIPEGQQLLKGNGILEGLSIIAIMGGTVAGGILADQSSQIGMAGTLVMLVISLLLSMGIPLKAGKPELRFGNALPQFWQDLQIMFGRSMTRFALIGNGSFWMTAAVLRIAYLSWMPLVLGMTSKADQAGIFAGSAVGVVFGAMLAPRLIQFGALHKAIPFAYVVVLIVVATPWLQTTLLTFLALLFMGFFGGLFVVPMNTLLQSEGKRLIGVGRTVSIANMAENVIMLLGLAAFQALAWVGLSLNIRMMISGLLMGVVIVVLQQLTKKQTIAS